MKRILLTCSVLGLIFCSSCEKDSTVEPIEKSSKADKGILCAGCGQWDIISPDPEPATVGVVTYDGPTDITASHLSNNLDKIKK